jgi:hypothetical protein
MPLRVEYEHLCFHENLVRALVVQSYTRVLTVGVGPFGAASSSTTLMFAELRRCPPAARSSSASSRLGMKSLGMRAMRSGVNHTGFARFHAWYLQERKKIFLGSSETPQKQGFRPLSHPCPDGGADRLPHELVAKEDLDLSGFVSDIVAEVANYIVRAGLHRDEAGHTPA